MQAWIFFYNMKKLEPRTRTKVLEKLFGKTKTSHNGKYQHILKGKLLQGRFIRPVRAVVIVQNKDVQVIKKYFKSYKIKHKLYPITVKRTDFKKKPFL